MKTFLLVPLIFLTACATTKPQVALRPQQPPSPTDSLRYSEMIRTYHIGRYVDPGDELVMNEQHDIYRVEENIRWNLQSLRTATLERAAVSTAQTVASRDAAFSPVPVNDDILAEVNSQRIATAQIMAESKILTAALQQLQNSLPDARKNELATANLRATVEGLKKRLDALETTNPSPCSTTNEPPFAP
jgi:preprotein translocase subunit SecD